MCRDGCLLICFCDSIVFVCLYDVLATVRVGGNRC